MKRYDVIDVAILDAPPGVVWSVLLDEFRGAGRWWAPYTSFRPGPLPCDEPGAEVNLTVHTRGARPGPKLRLTARTRHVEQGRRFVAEYVGGDFRGSGEYALDPIDDGRRTRLSLRWQARPRGKARLLARMVNIGEKHSESTRAAFSQLAQLVSSERPAPREAR